MARKFKRKLAAPPGRVSDRSWAVVGVDVSLSSMSGAALVYDGVMDKLSELGVLSERWTREIEFLDRLAAATKSGEFVRDLLHAAASVMVPTENVWIAVEEAWPAGIVKRAESGWLRQQAQVQGCFLGGLTRWGFHRVYEVNNQLWRRPVKNDTGIPRPDKFQVKEWAFTAYENVPDLPDLIKHDKLGLIPKPETSKAKPVQPDDIYDAIGIMAWMQDTREMEVE